MIQPPVRPPMIFKTTWEPVFFKIFHYSFEINVDGDAVADIIDEVFDEFDVDGAEYDGDVGGIE